MDGKSLVRTWGGIGLPSTLPDALLFVLSVFFRKIFILQLVGLVLTYNFTDCDFEKIRKKYQEVIYQALEKYMNGVSEETLKKQMCFHQKNRHTHIKTTI